MKKLFVETTSFTKRLDLYLDDDDYKKAAIRKVRKPRRKS
jgi:hypothetical protein